MSACEVIVWDDKYKENFIALSLEWLNKYVSVEPLDLEILNDPYGYILNQGGQIFFAKYGEEIVGTVSMIRVDENTFELAKLGVTEKYKGLKIGATLMAHCISFAKQAGSEKIILFTTNKLKEAVGLYNKYGFVEVVLVDNKYLESDVKMELVL